MNPNARIVLTCQKKTSEYTRVVITCLIQNIVRVLEYEQHILTWVTVLQVLLFYLDSTS